MARIKKSKVDPRNEKIGDWDYFYIATGELFRGMASKPVESRPVQFMALADKAEFVLRCARISAGLPEWRNTQ